MFFYVFFGKKDDEKMWESPLENELICFQKDVR